ncbi:MAG: hypothetical protein Cons2KO_12960 [Congregibacter sp.]
MSTITAENGNTLSREGSLQSDMINKGPKTSAELTKQTAPTAPEESATEKLAAAAHNAISNFEEKASDAEKLLRDKASELTSKGTDASAQAQELAGQAKSTALQYVEEKPVQSLAIAFGVGAVIATMLRK